MFLVLFTFFFDMQIILIAAMAANRVIGKDNQLPRDYPEDLKHFRKLTSGHTIVMGRKTYQSIGRPLPKRRNIVLSTSLSSWDISWVEIFASIETCLKNLENEEKIFVIGGSEIYKQFLVYADVIELTQIKKEFDGDTFFPRFEENFDEQKRIQHEAFDFITYIKK